MGAVGLMNENVPGGVGTLEGTQPLQSPTSKKQPVVTPGLKPIFFFPGSS